MGTTSNHHAPYDLGYTRTTMAINREKRYSDVEQNSKNGPPLSPEQMKHYKEKFKHAEILLGAKGNEPVTLKVEAYPKQSPEKADKGKASPER